MKLSSLHEEVVRSFCGGCHAPMGQQVSAPMPGIQAAPGQGKIDDTKMCPRCMDKEQKNVGDVDRPDAVSDRTSNTLAQVTQPPGGPKSFPESMPTGRIANLFHKNRPDM